MLHRQRALYVLLAGLGTRVLLALSFIYIVQISVLVAFYKLRYQQVLFGTRIKKQCKLSSKKNLGDALPVLRIIKVMMV
jgi:hypothetical protein